MHRTEEVLHLGGNSSPEMFMGRRNNKETEKVIDTGEPICELKNTEGGRTLIESLLQKGFKISDAFYQKRESEDSKARKKKHTKIKVMLVITRHGKEKNIEEITLKGIIRLARKIWICHIWNNLVVNKGLTVNFTYMHSKNIPKGQRFPNGKPITNLMVIELPDKT